MKCYEQTSRPSGPSVRLTSRCGLGFTLIELLVALTIMATAISIIWSTFSSTMKAWRQGSELLDGLHNGDFVMEQLFLALRSAAFFDSEPSIYGFHLEDRSGGYDEDLISWVTSSSAFIPPNTSMQHGLHRLSVTIEPNDEGKAAVAVRAFSHFSELEDDESDPWFVSERVKGLNCRVYNMEEEDWEDEWEDTNAVPSLVEITLTMDPIEEYGDPVVLKRMVEIPIAPAVTQAVSFAEDGMDDEDNEDE